METKVDVYTAEMLLKAQVQAEFMDFPKIETRIIKTQNKVECIIDFNKPRFGIVLTITKDISMDTLMNMVETAVDSLKHSTYKYLKEEVK